MPRPLCFIPEHSLVEITTRTQQGRLLLKPSPELTDIILGVIDKAQAVDGMAIHAFVALSNHTHFLLSPTGAQQLADFMLSTKTLALNLVSTDSKDNHIVSTALEGGAGSIITEDARDLLSLKVIKIRGFPPVQVVDAKAFARPLRQRL